MLTHTSGLPHYSGFIELGYDQEAFWPAAFTPRELAGLVGRMDLRFAPGERFSYSSPGYMLLGVILERVKGETFADLLEREIAGPLGLAATGYADNETAEALVARDYAVRPRSAGDMLRTLSATALVETQARHQSNTFATGGMHSTARDLFKWSRALRSGALLSAEMTEHMFAENVGRYGYGWFRNDEELFRHDAGVDVFSLGGQLSEYRSFLAMYADDVTVIMLSNIDRFDEFDLVHELHLAALERDTPVLALAPPNVENADRFRREGGMNALIAYHRELSRRAGYPVDPEPRLIDALVTQALEDGRAAEASEMAERVAGAYPDAAFAHLGCASVAAHEGRFVAAREHALRADSLATDGGRARRERRERRAWIEHCLAIVGGDATAESAAELRRARLRSGMPRSRATWRP